MNPQLLRYAITDRRQPSHAEQVSTLPEDLGAPLLRQASYLAAEGVEFLQLREKDLGAGDLAALARKLLRAVHNSATRLLINGRPDIAVAVGAHGVHLTGSPEELTAMQVHALFKAAGLPAPIVTASCHTLADVARHRDAPLDAILFGPVFEKLLPQTDGSEQNRLEGIGLDRLREACMLAAPLPVFALGGITSANSEACRHAGAHGVAGIRLFQRL